MTGRFGEAVPIYDRAQQAGFDEFWTRHNRGQALVSAGKFKQGRADLEAARSVKPYEVKKDGTKIVVSFYPQIANPKNPNAVLFRLTLDKDDLKKLAKIAG